MIAIQPVETKRQLKTFIDFPHYLYQSDPNYVPELFIAQRDLLTPGKHPFHNHAEVKMFLATEGGAVKGRIAAIINHNHNTFNKVNEGFFGFFDCENNQQVSNKLFETAIDWVRQKGVSKVIGPANPSTNEPVGVLVDGFDRPPVAMMTYNKPYYSQLMENFGFTKHTNLLAWEMDVYTVSDRSLKLQDALLRRLQGKGITIRSISMKHFKQEVANLRQIYNEAWDKNLGFVPMTEAEFNYMAKDLKMVLDPDFALIAEHNGRMVGFALAIPDINKVLIKINRGRLFPTGIFKLLFGAKKIKSVRVLALGVIEDYRKMGIEACFYAAIIKTANQKGIITGEASWILEGNDMMNKALEHINARKYKTYRLYEKAI